MKGLWELFERSRRHFDEGGRLRPAKPIFEAAENVFFASCTSSVVAPHVRDPLDVKRFMSMVIIALIPCVLTAVYFFGLRVLVMIAVSYAAGGTIEVLFAVIRKEQINEGFLVTGLLFPLIMPPTLPLWMVAAGVVFGVLIGKELFGGTGRNLFNPALVGRCFLGLSYPRAMSTNWVDPVVCFPGRLMQYVTTAGTDAVSGATPLGAAKHAHFADTWDLFFGNVSGSVGETSGLAVLIGGGFLLLTRVANWRTVAGMLGGFVLLAAPLHWADPERFGPVGWHLLAGGLLFGAFFMATDPVTSPITKPGKWAYGAMIGAVTVLIRNFTGYAEGVTFAILLGNILAPILDEIAFRSRVRRLRSER